LNSVAQPHFLANLHKKIPESTIQNTFQGFFNSSKQKNARRKSGGHLHKIK